jgi:hypothetical protein
MSKRDSRERMMKRKSILTVFALTLSHGVLEVNSLRNLKKSLIASLEKNGKLHKFPSMVLASISTMT